MIVALAIIFTVLGGHHLAAAIVRYRNERALGSELGRSLVALGAIFFGFLASGGSLLAVAAGVMFLAGIAFQLPEPRAALQETR